MKKTLLLFILTVATLFAFIPGVNAQEAIRNFRSTIHINTNGTIDVTENIVYDFGSVYRHGIYRNIPYTITNLDGKKFKMNLHSFTVTDPLGKKYDYEKSTGSDDVNLKIGDPDRTFNGQHTYIIKYQVSGALRYFSDHDELYWNVTGNEWTVPISDVQSTVTLPAAVAGPDLKVACYTGATGSTEADCAFNTDKTSIFFAAKRDFSLSEGMTIVIGFPKGVVTVLEPEPVFSQTPFGRLLIGIAWTAAGIAALWWYLLYPIKIVMKWFREGRDPKASIGEVRAGFEAPKGKDGKPLTPSETGAVLDEVVDQRDIAALMVDLARRGYLRIEERKKKDVYLVKTISKEKAPLLMFEKDLYEGIFATGSDIRLKDMRYKLATTVTEVKKDLYIRLVEQGLFPKSPESTRNFYTGMCVTGIMTGNLLLALAAGLFGRQIPKKTPAGADAKIMARSLKNFLTSQERQLEFQAKNQIMFEKLLPYAVAFGVEEIWAKRFEDLNMKPPTWYSGYNGATYRSTYLAQSLGHSFSSLSQATATVSSSGSGSGFSGGSGGGGGGGGGGSW